VNWLDSLCLWWGRLSLGTSLAIMLGYAGFLMFAVRHGERR
jgi:hypothetical protein